jgi:uncharacterized protein
MKNKTSPQDGVNIQVPSKQIVEFCRRHQIKRLSLFGSVLTERFKPDSDIDILVEFNADSVVGLLAMMRMQHELSVIFGGRKVDLRTPMFLSKYFRDQVMKDAKVQYEQ